MLICIIQIFDFFFKGSSGLIGIGHGMIVFASHFDFIVSGIKGGAALFIAQICTGTVVYRSDRAFIDGGMVIGFIANGQFIHLEITVNFNIIESSGLAKAGIAGDGQICSGSGTSELRIAACCQISCSKTISRDGTRIFKTVSRCLTIKCGIAGKNGIAIEIRGAVKGSNSFEFGITIYCRSTIECRIPIDRKFPGISCGSYRYIFAYGKIAG